VPESFRVALGLGSRDQVHTGVRVGVKVLKIILSLLHFFTF
jgi:hypothetical protein